MCGLHPPVVDLGFEASLFLLVFGAMLTAHLAGIATWYGLTDLARRFGR